MPTVQIKVSIDIQPRPEYNGAKKQVYIVEAQSSPTRGCKLTVLFPDHAELLVLGFKQGALLAGAEVVIFDEEGVLDADKPSTIESDRGNINQTKGG